MAAVETPKAAAPSPTNYHRKRKLIHLICFLIFMALPFTNVMRFDIPRQRFHFFGFELWINEFGIIFFALMFLMFVIVVSSVIYGRIYCSYACPQMIFSEASLEVEAWLGRKVNKRFHKWPAGRKKALVRAGWLGAVGVASVFLAFIFTSYFVEPRDLLARLLRLDMRTAGGITGAVVTLITLLDFTLVRQRFCTTVCPYGYLQGMLGDKNTLLVTYRDESGACIECKKCVRVCEMGIDIRKSAFQIECIHCGDCVDACGEVLARLGKPTLINYTWGETGVSVEDETKWYRRLGIRDAKRVVVLLVTLFYLIGLTVALSMRKNVMVQLQPVRAQMYRVDGSGAIANKFRFRLVNRGGADVEVRVGAEGLPGARLTFAPNPRRLKPGEVAEGEFEVLAERFAGSGDVNHFRIVTDAGGEQEKFDETFLMPPEGKK